MDKYNELMNRTEWFRNARFGMFIHFGLFSLVARHEWVRNFERTTNEDYQIYFDEFNPVHFDATEWAKTAKNAGMKYAVLTTKHHEGFCLWDTALTDYKSTNTKFGRDIVKEYVDAFRAEGLKVGLYYSIADWHHQDCPHQTDEYHPLRDNPDYPDDNRNFDNYINYMHGQIEELLSNYGKIDILWFDLTYSRDNKDTIRATELVEKIRKLQPEIIINARLVEKAKTIDPDNAPIYAGDFFNAEQNIPDEQLTDVKGRPVPWEACITTQDWYWGYSAETKDFMHSNTAIQTLADCVSKGGNLMLNVGPNGKGEIPKQELKLLKEIGEWLYENGDSIYGCGVAPVKRPEWGVYTSNGKDLYAHFFTKNTRNVTVKGLGNVKAAFLLDDMSEVRLRKRNQDVANSVEEDDTVLFCFNSSTLPNDKDTVVKIIK